MSSSHCLWPARALAGSRTSGRAGPNSSRIEIPTVRQGITESHAKPLAELSREYYLHSCQRSPQGDFSPRKWKISSKWRFMAVSGVALLSRQLKFFVDSGEFV